MVYLTEGNKVFMNGLGDGTECTLSMQMTQNQEVLTDQNTLVTQQAGATNQL